MAFYLYMSGVGCREGKRQEPASVGDFPDRFFMWPYPLLRTFFSLVSHITYSLRL